MEQSSSSSSSKSLRRLKDQPQPQPQPQDQFNLREWGFRTRISRENTMSRRYSASYITSFREDDNNNIHSNNNKSFRSNFTISSTASSPGYLLKDEIDPSTYSFTTALKALQARSVYGWECMSPEGFALNSKWYEAEKYISNPLSGEVPMECLSAKTLSARSFRNLTSRITMSAPLVYPSHHTRQMPTTPVSSSHIISHQQDLPHFTIQGKKTEGLKTRDVGTQSTPADISSSGSPSPSAKTPSIKERSSNRLHEPEDSPKSDINTNCVEQQQVVVKKESREKEETKKNKKEEMRKKKVEQSCKCFSLRGLWTKRQREKYKARKNNTIFPHHIRSC